MATPQVVTDNMLMLALRKKNLFRPELMTLSEKKIIAQPVKTFTQKLTLTLLFSLAASYTMFRVFKTRNFAARMSWIAFGGLGSGAVLLVVSEKQELSNIKWHLKKNFASEVRAVREKLTDEKIMQILDPNF